MIGPGGGAVLLVVVFIAAGAFLAAMLVAGVALLLWRKVRRVGWIVLAVWVVPAIVWGYCWLVASERDRYRTLDRDEVVYGVPLPAGSQVNFRKWARRVQWTTLPRPQTIDGVEYMVQVNFCHAFFGRTRVCHGILARDQKIDGVACRAGDKVVYPETTGRATKCIPGETR